MHETVSFLFAVFILLTGGPAYVSGESLVTLPRYEGPSLDIRSGYINVASNRSLFYLLFAPANIQSSSLVIWYQGGPGCSGLLGSFLENGPVAMTQEGPRYRQWNWGHAANASYLALEQPAGTGFSTGSGIVTEKTAAIDNANFLVEFIKLHPEFASIYLAGESHAGLYIPMLMKRLLELGDTRVLSKIRGISLGNPRLSCSDIVGGPWQLPYVQDITFNVLAYRGLVPWDLVNQWNSNSCFERGCKELYDEMIDGLGGINQGLLVPSKNFPSINPDNFLFDFCIGNGSLAAVDHPDPCPKTPMQLLAEYLNDPDVQSALHVKHPVTWTECTPLNWTFNGGNMMSALREIKDKLDVRLLIYNGDLDIMTIPAAMTRYCLEKWPGGPTRTGRQRPFIVNRATAGYLTKFKEFNYMTVHGAGHVVPLAQPFAAYEMYRRWISDTL